MFLPAPETSKAVERIYKSSTDAQGFVMNLMAAWAWRPDVFESFAALRDQLTSNSALSTRNHGRDRIGFEGLRHRNQRHRRAVAAKILAGTRDLLLHHGKAAW